MGVTAVDLKHCGQSNCQGCANGLEECFYPHLQVIFLEFACARRDSSANPVIRSSTKIEEPAYPIKRSKTTALWLFNTQLHFACQHSLNSSSTPVVSTGVHKMGRPKDFQAHFQDLIVKYKSKAAADKEYKTYMLMAKVGSAHAPVAAVLF